MRPLTDAERADRRDHLADRALELFASSDYSRLTIDAVARAAGVAKGSVFQAFASKEDLFLHGVRRRFELWFGRLGTLDFSSRDPEALAQALLDSLKQDPLLLPLMGLVGPVLEVGCSAEAVVDFKGALARGMGSLGVLWAPQFPQKEPGFWGPFFLGVYALTVGAWSVGEASANVKEALAGREDLQVFVTRFDDLFVALLRPRLADLFSQEAPHDRR